MYARWNSWRLIVLLAVASLLGVGSLGLRAEDGDAPAAEEAAEEATEKNPFAVPETDDVDELLAFIDEVRAKRPPRPTGPAEYREYVKYNREAPPAIEAAAKKILALETDKSSEAYKRATGVLLATKARAIMEAKEDDRAKLLDEVIATMKEIGVGQEEVGMAFSLANALERQDPKLGQKAYEEFGALVAKSDDEEIRKLATHFEGAARRMNLLGNKLEVLTGTTLKGDEFKWQDYRGKVVLVDFWATWCGPCVAELPNVKAAYEKYHDKGFEVVGISLDRDREALETFLEREPLPWTQLFQDEGRNKMAEYYGVNAIPTVLLVDREGKVINANARGRTLEAELEKIFGGSSESE